MLRELLSGYLPRRRGATLRRVLCGVTWTVPLAAGCARRPSALEVPVVPAPALQPTVPATPREGEGLPRPTGPSDASCDGCAVRPFTADESAAIERRIEELKAKGGACAAYGVVLERSYRAGRIAMRPYMWRVGAQLASGEGHPDGAIFLAREIDSLNVGRRPFDELLWTMEHEAAHIAFNLDSPLDRAPGDRADAVVKGCRTSARS